MLKRENTIKTINSNTYIKCRQTTNTAHRYKNGFELGNPIPLGRNVLLDNHPKGLLKSKKLQELRLGLYTVQQMLINTTPLTYKTTFTASSNMFNLPDANEILFRPPRKRKPPTYFGEPIPSDLIHKHEAK